MPASAEGYSGAYGELYIVKAGKKMEHNKQLYEHLFQAIRKQLESSLARTEGNDAFNIFKVLGIADKEVLICRLLGKLLDPKGSHGLGAKPLSLFLERLRIVGY